MRIGKAYRLVLTGAGLILVSVGCQTASRPAALLPAREASAPSIPASAAPADPPVADNPKPAVVTPSQSQPTTDPAAELIAQVEKEYQAGEENYRAGHVEAAKQNFDHAFDLLLESTLDIRSDERLQEEFDRLLDRVNGLELEALQQGDGFTEQKSEPAPIDEANEVSYPVDPSIKAKA